MANPSIQELHSKVINKINAFKASPDPKEFMDIGDAFKREIISTIESGTSPVEGQGRFKDYSDSYKNQIGGRFKTSSGRIIRKSFGSKFAKYNKTVRPVNLRLSGDMHRSIGFERTQRGFRIFFKSKLAYIHDTLGVGKKRVKRRLLPRGRYENFSRSLTAMLSSAAKKYLQRLTKL